MKSYFYALVLISLLTSCKSNTKPFANDDQGLAKKFSPPFRGVWVKKDYIDMVLKTGSPSAARNAAHDMTMMYLSADSIKGDSIVVPAIVQNRYPSRLVLKFKLAKTDSVLSFANRIDLSYSIKKGDTVLAYTYYNDYFKKIVTTKFTRALIKKPRGDLYYGMHYLINKELVTGAYTFTDKSGTSRKITFTNDGKVTGFYHYYDYKIRFDFDSGPMSNLDEMELYSDPAHYIIYTFKIDSGALTLYEVSPNTSSTILVKGKIACKLTRAK